MRNARSKDPAPAQARVAEQQHLTIPAMQALHHCPTRVQLSSCNPCEKLAHRVGAGIALRCIGRVLRLLGVFSGCRGGCMGVAPLPVATATATATARWKAEAVCWRLRG